MPRRMNKYKYSGPCEWCFTCVEYDAATRFCAALGKPITFSLVYAAYKCEGYQMKAEVSNELIPR